MLKILLLGVIAVTSAMAMHIGELNINNKDIEAQLKLDMGQFNDQLDPHTAFVGFRYINADKDHSDYNKDPKLFEINALMQREVGSLQALRLGIGIKVDYIDMGTDDDFTALPLGLEVQYRLPFDKVIPLHIGGLVYFAPEVLSFQDAKKYWEYKVNLDAEIIDNGFITTGYRYIETKYDRGSSHELNAAWFVGFKVNF
jgi:hypothetical protein